MRHHDCYDDPTLNTCLNDHLSDYGLREDINPKNLGHGQANRLAIALTD